MKKDADNGTEKACCAPARDGTKTTPVMSANRGQHSFEAVQIPGGQALIGTQYPQIPDDGEGPLRRKKLKPFQMARAVVTNSQFKDFIDDTGYVTEAETFGWSFVFWSDVTDADALTEGVVGVEWWRRVEGANWRDICGPGSEMAAWHPDHPVVHVSHHDALAYAGWAGGRLPTEAEWEHAARGGCGDVKYPWGNEDPTDKGPFPCNIWQGSFPNQNTKADGWGATAPAQSFAPNGYGLYNLVGNVWEWTSDTYRVRSLKKQVRKKLETMQGYRVVKGGSFLCHKSYCYRYRIAARTGNSPDSATTHTGFRMVWDT